MELSARKPGLMATNKCHANVVAGERKGRTAVIPSEGVPGIDGGGRARAVACAACGVPVGARVSALD